MNLVYFSHSYREEDTAIVAFFGRRALPLASDKERELLSAIRDNGGVITPTEAAMETSLTVKEADRRLSELAGGGHLSVESAGGTLCYSLPGRQATELDEPSSAT